MPSATTAIDARTQRWCPKVQCQTTTRNFKPSMQQSSARSLSRDCSECRRLPALAAAGELPLHFPVLFSPKISLYEILCFLPARSACAKKREGERWFPHGGSSLPQSMTMFVAPCPRPAALEQRTAQEGACSHSSRVVADALRPRTGRGGATSHEVASCSGRATAGGGAVAVRAFRCGDLREGSREPPGPRRGPAPWLHSRRSEGGMRLAIH